MFFALLLSLSFFQLRGMEEKRVIDLCDIPKYVINKYILSAIIPDFCMRIASTKDSNEIERYNNAKNLYIVLNNRAQIINIASINKYFFEITRNYVACNPHIKHIDNIPLEYCLLDLLNYFQFPKFKFVKFEVEKKWYEISAKESAQIQIDFVDKGNNTLVLIKLICAGKNMLPMKMSDRSFEQNDSVKIVHESAKIFTYFINTSLCLKNKTETIHDHTSQNYNQYAATLEYHFDRNVTISYKDAVLIYNLLKDFDLSESSDTSIFEKIKTYVLR
ncbi:MAG TPA: hypothetical protein VL201_00600 [Patescibacteria group bacterium]|jgi:hypothetical protein|nr:hypothetical protein [Patescibacteria group bacterium]